MPKEAFFFSAFVRFVLSVAPVKLTITPGCLPVRSEGVEVCISEETFFREGHVTLPMSYWKPPYVISISFLSDHNVAGFACRRGFVSEGVRGFTLFLLQTPLCNFNKVLVRPDGDRVCMSEELFFLSEGVCNFNIVYMI